LLVFERTTDYALIKSIATHPRNYVASSDDFSASPEEWEPIEHESVWYVLAKDGDEFLGMFVFMPENAVCWKAHICLLPNAYGEKAREAGQGIIRWVFEHTVCERIIGDIEEENELALKYVYDLGMVRYGLNPDSKKRCGTLRNQVLVGMSKSWV